MELSAYFNCLMSHADDKDEFLSYGLIIFRMVTPTRINSPLRSQEVKLPHELPLQYDRRK